MAFTGLFGQKTPIIVDADTGNEMDDFYAITSALLDKELEVKALISAHFNNDQLLTDSVWHIYPTEDINTVQISQDENIKLLESLNKIDIPHPIGCDRMVGYAWGYYPGAPVPSSPGVDYIISQAKNVKNGKKLNIVCLGAVTNVAAAILTDTSIAKNIRLYALNMKYDIEKEIWDKNSFNARNDINGLDVILNNKDLEIYIMPGNVSRKMKFKRQESIKKLTNLNHPIAKILSKRWDEVNAGNSWIMWDLALIEAISKPNLAHLEKTNTPPENVTQKIGVYTDIEASKMKKRFWEKIERLK
jgi:inosine-uridine nucleoside N-ribohydrolase